MHAAVLGLAVHAPCVRLLRQYLPVFRDRPGARSSAFASVDLATYFMTEGVIHLKV